MKMSLRELSLNINTWIINLMSFKKPRTNHPWPMCPVQTPYSGAHWSMVILVNGSISRHLKYEFMQKMLCSYISVNIRPPPYLFRQRVFAKPASGPEPEFVNV